MYVADSEGCNWKKCWSVVQGCSKGLSLGLFCPNTVEARERDPQDQPAHCYFIFLRRCTQRDKNVPHLHIWKFQFHSVQLLCCIWLTTTPWTVAHQGSLSKTTSQSLIKLMSMEPVMTFNHHILCCPLLLLPSLFPSIKVFSNKSVLCIRWPKYWSFSFSISPSSECSGLISFRMDWLDLLAVQGTLKSLLQLQLLLRHFSRVQLYVTP